MSLFSNYLKLKELKNNIEIVGEIFSLTGAAFNCSSYQQPRRLRGKNANTSLHEEPITVVL
jgi:hypothetical protein